MFHLKYYDDRALMKVSQQRHTSFQKENRGSPLSAWRFSPDQLVASLSSWVSPASTAAIPDFDPHDVPLDAVVQSDRNGYHRTTRLPQIDAMETYPLRKLPQRFASCL
jgi:hypothetical protein